MRCGYTCRDYSNAVFLRKEERLNLGLRGGKETVRMRKTFYRTLGHLPPQPAPPVKIPLVAAASVAPAALRGRSRVHSAEQLKSEATLTGNHASFILSAQPNMSTFFYVSRGTR